ncbi:hypothetical protein PAF17_03655 [Paracoccus sp. Z330]|uniref:DUF982 domain-containing protein n=1 Tax=Paracoccus onchidii TaxID=3017813 RepID=A0ABT4ZBS6_9RHOB|nr:hypothetical protein [Paracoccus onchidii]MDB6176597.1 hypothetical protein [Paracoccus onchidii]
MPDDAPHSLSEADPKNLIRESFAIDGISAAQCRSIFLDWALSLPDNLDQIQSIRCLLDHYAPAATLNDQRHPMIAVLVEAVQAGQHQPRRRGGRAARVSQAE